MQLREAILDSVPDAAVIDGIVTVNQDVSESNDLSVIVNERKRVRIAMTQSYQRFAADFKIAFNGGTEQIVRQIVVQRLAARLVEDKRHSGANVFE